jgi:MFS family permease
MARGAMRALGGAHPPASGQAGEARGMRAFLVIWAGQTVSLMGSGLTRFALGVWVYQTTGSAGRFALILLFSTLPAIVAFPFVGVLVDRWDRRRTLIAANVAAALNVLAIALLLYAGSLQIWHVYAAVSVSSVIDAFQRPALEAVTAQLVPARHFGRASGITQAGQAADRILAPLVAGVLVLTTGLKGVVLVDAATYLFALATLAVVRIPAHRPPAAGDREPFRRNLAVGWRFIAARPGLVGLVIFFIAMNLSLGITQALFTPLVLSMTDARSLGAVLSTAGFGTLAGSVLMGVWGGPQRRIHGLLGGGVMLGMCVAATGVRPSLTLVSAAWLGTLLSIPLVNGCNQAIWFSKTPRHLQGRVFATRSMLCWCTSPVAYLIAAPLADMVLAPLTGNSAAAWIAGTGPGREMGLAFVLVGVTMSLTACGAWLCPRVRFVEDELPDAGAEPVPEVVPDSTSASLARPTAAA